MHLKSLFWMGLCKRVSSSMVYLIISPEVLMKMQVPRLLSGFMNQYEMKPGTRNLYF